MSEQAPAVGPTRAVRLTFAYAGDEITLVDRRALEVVVPPSDDLADPEGARGFWVELRGDQEQVLHRRTMLDPLRQDAEVFSPDPDQGIARVPVEVPSGTFSVLLPAPEEADHVALMGASTPGVPTLMAGGAQGPVELARFSLR